MKLVIPDNLMTDDAVEQRKQKDRERARLWRLANPEKAKERARKYRATHRAQHCAASRRWHQANQERDREYRQNHREAGREKSRKWAAAHPEKVSQRNRRWYEANKERARENTRKWRRDHPNHRREWERCHPERERVKGERRRARKRGNGGSYTAQEWQALCEKYGNKCIGPGPHRGPLCADHIVPLVKGGPNTIDNIQPLCRSCNSRKYTEVIDYRSVYCGGAL